MGKDKKIDLDAALTLGTGIAGAERQQVLDALDAIENRLRSYDEETLRIEAWVKNRDDTDQVVYLSVKANGIDIAAHDQSRDFGRSLLEARNDLRRQLTDAHDRKSDRR